MLLIDRLNTLCVWYLDSHCTLFQFHFKSYENSKAILNYNWQHLFQQLKILQSTNSPTPKSPSTVSAPQQSPTTLASTPAAVPKATSPAQQSAMSQVIQRPRGPPPVLPGGVQGDSTQTRPPDLVLPEDNLWDVYVTHIFSTVEVCIRLLGEEHRYVC